MVADQRRSLPGLEGRSVHISLAGGTRLDEVALVSARRSTLWIFVNGEDRFVPFDQVIDIWEAPASPAAA